MRESMKDFSDGFQNMNCQRRMLNHWNSFLDTNKPVQLVLPKLENLNFLATNRCDACSRKKVEHPIQRLEERWKKGIGRETRLQLCHVADLPTVVASRIPDRAPMQQQDIQIRRHGLGRQDGSKGVGLRSGVTAVQAGGGGGGSWFSSSNIFKRELQGGRHILVV
jgi:hypothetical protein